jgi:hypothetical protein
MLDSASQHIKNALEKRWVDAGAPVHATELILGDMDTKTNRGLLIEACDMLNDWIALDAYGPTADETTALTLAKEALG